jgi:hypothetical protein
VPRFAAAMALPVGRASPTPTCQLTLAECERAAIEPPLPPLPPTAAMVAPSSTTLPFALMLIEPPLSLFAVAPALKALPDAVTFESTAMTRIAPPVALLPEGLDVTLKNGDAALGPKT